MYLNLKKNCFIKINLCSVKFNIVFDYKCKTEKKKVVPSKINKLNK